MGTDHGLKEHPLLYTTIPGLEDISADEFREKASAVFASTPELKVNPFGYMGSVVVYPNQGTQKALLKCLWTMRSAHHILELFHVFELKETEPLKGLLEEIRELEIPEMETTQSFRVSCKRKGEHPFGSMDVEREVGGLMVEKHGRKVDLENYHTHLRVNVYRDTVIVAIQITSAPLSKRYHRPFLPRVTLKPTIAYCMLRLAGLTGKKGEKLLDPFCGSGTILLEAASIFPGLEIHGSDTNPIAVNGARTNMEASGVEERVIIKRRNAHSLADHHPPSSFDAIVTNPPYGLKMLEDIDFGALYGAINRQFDKILAPNGKVVIMVWKKRLFERITQEEGLFKITSHHQTETGGIYLHLLTLERK